MKFIAVFNATLGLSLLSALAASADERVVLQYDSPATDNLLVKQKGRAKGLGFIQTALPLGNGRLGAMFSGAVDQEHLLINDITLWMHSTRGESEFKQSGSPENGKDFLESVRAACRFPGGGDSSSPTLSNARPRRRTKTNGIR